MLLHWKPFFTLLCVILYVDNVRSLELIEFRVPTEVPLGIRTSLQCYWALGPNDVLYSVKWYKDGKEFFRHIPGDDEPQRKFLLPGVDVQEFDLFGSNLTLAPAVFATSGRYRCEVSGERPQFHTVSEHADMVVLVLPSQGLSIHGFDLYYHAGDHVNASCVSDQSKYPVKLTWYINGEAAIPTSIAQPMYDEDDGVTRLEIQFTIEKSLVGTLKLQCVATTIGSVYWRSIGKSTTVTVSASEVLKNTEDTRVLKYSTLLPYPMNGISGSKQQLYILIASIFILLYSL